MEGGEAKREDEDNDMICGLEGEADCGFICWDSKFRTRDILEREMKTLLLALCV